MSFSRKIDRFPYIIGAGFVVLSTLVVLSEAFVIPWSQYSVYAPVRLILTFAAIPIVVKFRRMSANDLETGIFFALTWLGSFWGSWYRADYEFGFIQCALACSFVMTRRTWIYPVVFGIGALFMWTGIWVREAYDIQVTRDFTIDWFLILAIFLVMGVVINQFFFRERVFREEALFRFSTLGQQAFQIAHDLKGLMNNPILQVEHLREKLEESSRDELIRSLESVNADLDRMRTLVLQLNRMVIRDEERGEIDLCAIIERVKLFFGSRLSGVTIVTPERMVFSVYEGRVQSVLFNLILNSLEAFDSRPHPSPTIWIEEAAKGFFYRDNAGGAPASILAGLKKGAFVSTKGIDRGVGLSFVQQDLQSMGGRAKFQNDGQGFVVEISLPRPSENKSLS